MVYGPKDDCGKMKVDDEKSGTIVDPAARRRRRQLTRRSHRWFEALLRIVPEDEDGGPVTNACIRGRVLSSLRIDACMPMLNNARWFGVEEMVKGPLVRLDRIKVSPSNGSINNVLLTLLSPYLLKSKASTLPTHFKYSSGRYPFPLPPTRSTDLIHHVYRSSSTEADDARAQASSTLGTQSSTPRGALQT